MNNKLKIILPVILVSSAAFVIFQVKNNSNNSQQTNTITPKSNNITSTDQITSNQIFQQLSVLPTRCIGCGKCNCGKKNKQEDSLMKRKAKEIFKKFFPKLETALAVSPKLPKSPAFSLIASEIAFL